MTSSPQPDFIQPLITFCQSATGVTPDSVSQYIITSYIPYLVSTLAGESSLSTAQKQQIVVANLQTAIQAAATLLDQKFPADTAWINIINSTLGSLIPHIVSMCIVLSASIQSSTCWSRLTCRKPAAN